MISIALPVLSNQYCHSQVQNKPGVSFGTTRFGTTDELTMYRCPDGVERPVKHYTSMFRDDSFFDKFVALMRQRFSNGAKLLCYAASDGSEPYSLAITLIKQCGYDTAKERFPLHCFDLIERMASQFRKRLIQLEDFRHRVSGYPNGLYRDPERQALMEHHFKHLSLRWLQKFIPGYDEKLYALLPPSQYFLVSKPLYRFIQSYQAGDLHEDVKRFQFQKPVIVLFRNAWWYPNGYTDKEVLQVRAQQQQLAQRLFEKLPAKSWVVVGTEELKPGPMPNMTSVAQVLTNVGFRQLGTEMPEVCIFERP